MSEPSEKNPRPVTRKQRLTIAGLALVLAVVLFVQFGSAGSISKKGEGVMPSGPRPRNDRLPSAGAIDRPWPEFALPVVLQCDPFAKGAPLIAVQKTVNVAKHDDPPARTNEEAPKKRAEYERRLAQIRKESVRMIVGSEKDFAAVVGSKTFHVGDRFHGFRISKINAEGMFLEDEHP
jgi:hypothetical protein